MSHNAIESMVCRRTDQRRCFIIVASIVALAGVLFTSLAATIQVQDDLPDQGPELIVTTNTANTNHSRNLETVKDFLEDGKYLHWEHDPYIRPTGDIYHTTEGDLIDGTTHHRVRIYYSPHVVTWLKAGRPADQPLPDRSMIVKEMYQTVPPIYPKKDPVIGWAAMVKKEGASHGGWYWVIYFKEQFRSMDTVGMFSYSFCLTCHASTTSENTFASLGNLTGENATELDGRSFIQVANPLFMKNLLDESMADEGGMPNHEIDPEFQKLYSNPDIYPRGYKLPDLLPEATGPLFPSTNFDHVWNRTVPADRSYLTSDNCVGCHDATLLVETQTPNMLIRNEITHSDGSGTTNSEELLNLSVYGEWRASPMGMAGRDPIFFAQLESELNTYPDDAANIQNLCLSCHGAMGQRQFKQDHNGMFTEDMVFRKEGPMAKYGALAREGISCMICHQMDPDTIYSNTGKFERGPWDIIYGSTSNHEDPGGPIRTHPMEHALGLTPEFNSYVNNAHVCGTCHTIDLQVEHPDVQDRYHTLKPVLNDGTVLLSEAHEQDTFLEWMYSAYQNANPRIPVNAVTARTCQDCHMNPEFQGNGVPVGYKVANVENESWPIPPAENLAPAKEITVPSRPNVGRHTFFGMNLFVLTFYEQFADSIFGLEPDPNPPMGTVSSQQLALQDGEWAIKNRTAMVDILDVSKKDGNLVARVRVENQAGHRLPSGVGFRRAWIELQVQDDQGKLLWGSGVSNSQGVLVGADEQPLKSEFTEHWELIQPHWEQITKRDQVQIYEERYVNLYGDELRLNTSFLGIGMVIKDNRLQPLGYQYDLIEKLYRQAKANDDEAKMEKFQSLLPESKFEHLPDGAANPNDDENYKNGSGADEVTYLIPLKEITGAAVVTAQLNYQNIPPYYLRDRFSIGDGGEQTQRLYYLVGHTNVDGSPIEGWKIRIAADQAPVPQR